MRSVYRIIYFQIHLVFEIKITWSQLVALFGEVMEPLRGGVLQEEVHHWGWVVRVYSFSPLSVLPLYLCFQCRDEIQSLCFLLLLPCFSCHDGRLSSGIEKLK